MRKSNCEYCIEGIVFNTECDKIVSGCYCAIDAYDEEIGCTNCQYRKENSEVKLCGQ
jgi:hypothetical protein